MVRSSASSAPTGGSRYVASFLVSSVAVLSRDTTTGALTQAPTNYCIKDRAASSNTSVP